MYSSSEDVERRQTKYARNSPTIRLTKAVLKSRSIVGDAQKSNLMRRMIFGVDEKRYGISFNEVSKSVCPREGHGTAESQIRSSDNNRLGSGPRLGAKYKDVAKERPDYCKEVDREAVRSPFPRWLAGYFAIRDTSIDGAMADFFDKGTVLSNDMGRGEDQCRIEDGPYIGKVYIDISKDLAEYLEEIRGRIRDKPYPFVDGDGSLANFAKHISGGNSKIDANEEVSIEEFSAYAFAKCARGRRQQYGDVGFPESYYST